jgi:hypothetical protein
MEFVYFSEKTFKIPETLGLSREQCDSMAEAVKEIKALKAEINYLPNNGHNRQRRQKLQLREKFLQKKIDEYNKLNSGFDLIF